jgi:hypothetical protein
MRLFGLGQTLIGTKAPAPLPSPQNQHRNLNVRTETPGVTLRTEVYFTYAAHAVVHCGAV